MSFKLKEQFYFHLEELIKFNSVLFFSLQNKPFGEQIDLCLDKVLEIAQDIGFKVYKVRDGYYGFADMGKGDELIGILTHIDIVDSGNISNWHSDPFKLSFRDGKVYARDILDDKGPLMAVLYAFKLLISKGTFFNKRFRVIFGTDEETAWRCIEQYKIKEEIPSIAFTLDGYFPVVNAEKGLLQFDVISDEKFFMNFDLGTGYNVIPDECVFKLGDSNKCDFRFLLDSFEGKINISFLRTMS